MPKLYNISFTTQKLVGKFDSKGELVCEKALNKPIAMTMLPYVTAMKYSGCDNFTIEPYVFQNQGGIQKSRVSTTGIGNGTRKVERSAAAAAEHSPRKPKASKAPAKSALQRAAESGDMTEALNNG